MVCNSSCACPDARIQVYGNWWLCAVERLNRILASLHVEKIHKQLSNNKRYTNTSMDVGVDNWNVGGTLLLAQHFLLRLFHEYFAWRSFTSAQPVAGNPTRGDALLSSGQCPDPFIFTKRWNYAKQHCACRHHSNCIRFEIRNSCCSHIYNFEIAQRYETE